jgi:glycosyltransferase involved in cell wall biosynthesis
MRIAVVNNTVPFLRGGAEELADGLVEQLIRRGHEAELVRLPFAWATVGHVYDAMMAASLTRIAGVDLVVPIKFPAYLVPHPNKVTWLAHQFRQFYDLWDTPHRGYPDTPEVREVRDLVRRADTESLLDCRRFVISGVARDRLQRFNGLSSTVLAHPLRNPEQFANRGTGDYLFAGGRINAAKRQVLAIEAMAHTTSDVRLVVAGESDTPDDRRTVERALEASPARDRITLDVRFISDEEKADLVNRSRGVVYLPYDEDSYGYVTLEAAQAAKAIVTTRDAGGVLDLAIDRRSALVVEPTPEALGGAFDELARSTSLAESLGRAAAQRTEELEISWDHVVHSLVSASA